MFRRLLVAVAVATVLLVPATPARAYEDACAFNGIMTTSATPLPNSTVDFFLTITVGTCVNLQSLSMTGRLKGALLGVTTGTGFVNTTGQQFSFTGAGGVLELAGQVVGTLTFTLDPFAATIFPIGIPGNRYLVEAAIVLVN